jgi:hypothetical protein
MQTTWIRAAILLLALGAAPLWAVQEKTEQEPAETQEPAAEKPLPLEETWTTDDFSMLDADAAAKVIEEIKADFEKRQSEFTAKLRSTPAAERQALRAEAPDPAKLNSLMQHVAEQYPQSEAELEALLWIATRSPGGPEFDAAFDQLLAHHASSPKLGPVVTGLGRQLPSPALDQRLQSILDDPNVSREVKGLTHYARHNMQSMIRRIQTALNEDAEAASIESLKTTLGDEGFEFVKNYTLPTEEELLAKLESIAKEYADVELRPGTTLGSTLENEIFEIKFLSIGKTAPDIEGEDIDGVEFKLSDYRGKVVVVDFWGDW